MKDGVPVAVCSRCRHAAFPDPLLCSRCGSSDWRREWIAAGVVEDATLVRRAPGGIAAPVRVGTVRLSGGPRVVARLEPGASAGAAVMLGYDDGVPVARAGATRAAAGEGS